MELLLPVSKWISLDAPHQGAHIPNVFQDFLKGENTAGTFDSYGLENVAAKTLLEYNTYDVNADLRTDFVSDLNSLNSGTGYPQLIPKIGISFSSTDVNPNSGIWIGIDGPLGHDFFGYLQPEDIKAGSFLPKLNIDPFHVLGGIGTVTITQYADPTFIPHASSLDLDSDGNSPFDEQIIPSMTGFHDVVPDELVSFMLNSILFDENIFFQNKIFTTAYEIHVRNTIEAGRAVRANIPEGDVVVDADGDVVFKAGVAILLEEGFIVKSNFLAKIEMPELVGSGCDDEEIVSNDDIYGFRSNNDENAIIGMNIDIKNISVTDVRVYPNPVKDILTFEACELVKIYDVRGQLYLTLEDVQNSRKVNVSSWPKGLYVCVLNGGQKQIKIIKI